MRIFDLNFSNTAFAFEAFDHTLPRILEANHQLESHQIVSLLIIKKIE